MPRDTNVQLFIIPFAPVFTLSSSTSCVTASASLPSSKKVRTGLSQVYRWRSTGSKIGNKIIQYVLENLGGRQMKLQDLVSHTTPKNTMGKFEDKDDEEIDRGFDYIPNDGPRSTSEMAQLPVDDQGSEES